MIKAIKYHVYGDGILIQVLIMSIRFISYSKALIAQITGMEEEEIEQI